MSETMLTAIAIAFQLATARTAQDEQLVALAKATVIATVEGKPLHVDSPRLDAHPVFITIEIDGKVRGCRGSLTPLTPHLDSEVAHFSAAAALHDPRYRRLELKELTHFLVTVTVVDSVEPLADISGLKPSDGLVLSSGGKKGIVLPYEGRDPRLRLRWAYQKAGVAEGSAAQLYLLHGRRTQG